MKKILVTGADGQLGRSIRDVAIEYSNNEFFFANRELLNITDRAAVSEIFRNNKFAYCINTAAYTNVEKAESESDKAFLINADGVRNISEACQQYGTTLIQVSTDYVFDGEREIPYSEEDKTKPINVYGASKLKGEEFVQDLCRNHFIIRTSWLYSKYGHNFLKTILKNADEGNPLTITTEQTGTPTNAVDLARAILEIISTGNGNYGLYHFSNDGEATWYDFAEAILKYSKQIDKTTLAKTEHYRTFAARPKYSVLNKDKICDTFNIKATNWKDSLQVVISTIYE